MTFTDAGWVFTATLLVLWLPGVVIAYAWRLRGIVAWGVAPALTVGITSGTAIIGGFASISWSLWPVVAVTIVAVALGAVVTGTWRDFLAFITRRGPGWRLPDRRTMFLWAAAFVAVAATIRILATRIMRSMGSADAIAQGNDIPFHLNAVKNILTSGSASSLDMTLAAPERAHSFYPAAWHGLIALIVQVTGCGIDVATNVLAVVVAVIVWPTAMMAFTRAIFGARPDIVAATGILALSFTQFPGHLLTWGILYPNLLSYALTPALLALVLSARHRRGRRLIQTVLPIVLASVGVLLAQPNGIFCAFVVLLPWLQWRLFVAARNRFRRGERTAGLTRWAIANAVIVVAVITVVASPAIAAMRTNPGYIANASWQRSAACFATLGAPHTFPAANWPLVVLIGLGIVAAVWVVRARWLVVALIFLAILFVTARGPGGIMRDLLTAPWYHDSARIAAMIPIVALPLAALGVVAVVRVVARIAGPRGLARPATIPIVAVVIFVAVAGAGWAMFSSAAQQLRHDLDIVYSQSGERLNIYPTGQAALDAGRGWCGDNPTTLTHGLFDDDERAFIDEVAAIVPPDQAVVSDPRDGSALVWALGGVKTLTPALNMELGPDLAMVVGNLNQARDLPEVCTSVNRLSLNYVLNWGEGIWDRRSAGFQGLQGLGKADVVELVAKRGQAKLYRITACD